MNLRTFLVLGASALFGLCLAITFVGSTAAQRPPSGKDRTDPGVIGRYQGAVGQTHFCLFDTATGQVWTARAGEAWTPAIEPLKP
jgi:hypothetical protein